MLNRVVVFSLLVKLSQGFLAYLNIIVQSKSLTTAEFGYLSVIGNAIVLSMFLDMGVGTQFVQDYFKNVDLVKPSNENLFALSFLRSRIRTFFVIILAQSILIVIYAVIFQKGENGFSGFAIFVVTIIVTLLFSLGA